MINRTQLLADLQIVLRRLEADLLERSEEMLPVQEVLREEHLRARTAERTAQNYNEWRADYITQMAAAWVLSGVFVRFLEDNRLIDPPRIAGPGERLTRARDEHELYFRAHPTETDREYLLHAFGELARLPGTKDIFGAHNPIHELPTWLSGDAAGALLTFFQRIDANTGALVHDFTDPGWNTRFLGDLYQDLSEAARKKYALLQTPEFVEEFILDRTLEPAIEEFGLQVFRMIDPACGSGHFLLGSFTRLLHYWLRKEPGTNVRGLVQRALDSIHGVDVNPYAIAIARFRLLLAAMKACDVWRLIDAPEFHMNLVCGDSLIHGTPGGDQLSLGWHELNHVYRNEDLEGLRHILKPGHFHAVVANPPYITPKDRALNQAYRQRYSSCHMKYSLSIPFMQRIFSLTLAEGYAGQITANSFMKREFGKKLIEEFFPHVDLTHIVDTSLAYIPGHGTPTVIVFGRHRKPITSTVRAVMGIKRENEEPADPAKGLVWAAILAQIDQPGSQSEFLTVTDVSRQTFAKHPWSLGGGGATELKELIDNVRPVCLGDLAKDIGFLAITGEDETFIKDYETLIRHGISRTTINSFVVGERIRDWAISPTDSCIFPYDELGNSKLDTSAENYLWPFRSVLNATLYFGKTKSERGVNWWEYVILLFSKLTSSLSIAFAFVATHNHFVLDRGGKVFKQSAPIIKLPSNATEGDHLTLLGLLNSSIAAFWLRQTCHDKGGGGIGGGIAAETWERFFEYTGTKLQDFPLPLNRPVQFAQQIDCLAQRCTASCPSEVMRRWRFDQGVASRLGNALHTAYVNWYGFRQQLVTRQEELDWQCYHLYGLIDEDLTYRQEPPSIQLGQRAFEIVMARKMAAGELETTWFERHGSTPVTAIPAEWPEDYRRLVERRIALIETDSNIALIEQPEYKRRWNTEPWESQLEQALRRWLLDRLESSFDFDGRMNDTGTPTAKLDIALISTIQLADVARQDAAFMQVGELYRNDPDNHIEGSSSERYS